MFAWLRRFRPDALLGPPRVLYGQTHYGWWMKYVDPNPLTRYRPLSKREIAHLKAHGWC